MDETTAVNKYIILFMDDYLSGLLTKREVKMAEYSLRYFFLLMNRDKHSKKETNSQSSWLNEFG